MQSLRESLTRTQATVLTRLGDRRWLLRYGLPVLIALAILCHAWWTYATVQSAAQQALADEITALRDAISTSVVLWLRQQQTFVEVLANQSHVVADTKELLQVRAQTESRTALMEAPAQSRLQSLLRPVLAHRDYFRFRVLSPDGVVLSASIPDLIGRPLPITQQSDLMEKLKSGAAGISRPFRDRFVIDDPKLGKVNRDEPAMLALAPIRGPDGKPIAFLSFQMKPEEEFTRILNATRSGKTMEAYAFDRHGLMLTSSRFDDMLRQLGLIPPDGASILTLELRDPGANLLKGGRPAVGRFQQPLIKPVASGSAGETGLDVEGYPDYRGVPTVGAWTWLPEYGMGIAVEEDAAEAHAPLQRLRLAFGMVFGALVLAAAAGIAAMFFIAAQARKLRLAVRESKKLGHYTLEEKLGEGGMGEVYRGSHALLRRPVAIKLLKPELSSDRALARFEREVQTTSRLQHPNTIGVFDFGRTEEGVFYYVMEFLEGLSLEHLVREHGPPPPGRSINILLQVCGSLEEAHGLGLIHRDIKPANIMLCRRHGQVDVVKVLDFGLVKDIGGEGDQGQTLSEGITGTPLYLAPEAIQNPDEVGPGRDIYAIGAVGYFLLTGKPPFEGRNLLEICQKHVATQPIPPSERVRQPVDPELESIVLKCLAKNPADRFASVTELADALQGVATRFPWRREDAAKAWNQIDPALTRKRQAGQPSTHVEQLVAATVDFKA